MGAVLCVAGLFFLSVTAAFTIERGDLLVLVGSFFWAAHVQVVGWLSPRTDPVRLACVQFAVCSVASAGGALLTEHVSVRRDPRRGGAHPLRRAALRGHRLHPAGGGAAPRAARARGDPSQPGKRLRRHRRRLLLGERLGARGALGCALMFAGMIVSQAPSPSPLLQPARVESSM